MTALDAALAAIAEEPADELVRAKVTGLLIGYDAKWSGVPWETLSVEEEYELPLINPETARASRTFTHAGKFDGIVLWPESGKRYLLEHKTVASSEDIADPSSTYWKRLKIDSQISGYNLAKLQLGVRLDGTVYDVIRKPGIRPKELKGDSYRQLVQNGTYCGFKVEDKAVRLECSQTNRENAQLYSLRLARECMNDPARYFQRRTIPRLDLETLKYAGGLWDVGQAILEQRRTGRHMENSDACMLYGSPCEYLDICCGEDTVESDRWQRVDSVHGELTAIQGDGKNVLTNSRIRCLKSCEMKHHLRYELGVRRRDEEEREALHFGRLMHLALGAWWNCFKANENVDIGNTANEVVRPGSGLESRNRDKGERAPF